MNRDYRPLIEIISGRKTGLVANAARGILFVLSLVYRGAIGIRNWAFDSVWRRCHRVTGPVLSVGNLTTGGTGKTPFVVWLAERIGAGNQVAIVSRGYGSRDGLLNDEGREIQQRLPHVIQCQNPDRVAAARQATEQFATVGDVNSNSGVIILDDGFQHRRLARDLDIVLIDATRPFGFDYLIPRGLLREPVASIRRADVAVLTRANLVTAGQIDRIRQRLLRINPNLVWAETELVASGWLSTGQEKMALDSLAATRLFAFCGIGNPDAFLETLARLAFRVEDSMFFNDHHEYTETDVQSITTEAQRLQCDAIVCTPKDLVKIEVLPAQGLPVYALLTGLRISRGGKALERAIAGVLPELEDTGRDEPAKPVSHR